MRASLQTRFPDWAISVLSWLKAAQDGEPSGLGTDFGGSEGDMSEHVGERSSQYFLFGIQTL